jgi:cell division protein FtsA
MTIRRSTVVGLDIGSTKVTVLVAEYIQEPDKEAKLNVIGIGTTPSTGLRKGVVINIEATVESINSALAQAEAMAGRPIKSVFASISGNHIQSFNSHGIVGIKEREVGRLDIEKVIEAAKAVAIPLDREVLHVLPQEFIIDEQDGIKEPLGISGVRLEARVHIITGAIASAQNIVKCANRCGLSVSDIVLAPLATARAVLSEEEKELGVCLLDIGGGTTDLTVFHNGAIKHTAVLPIGGNHITNDLAAGLHTPLAAAEQIKCKYGSALMSATQEGETIEVPSAADRPSRILSKQLLSEIIEPRVTELFNLVQKNLIRAGCEEMISSGMVLTGGTAKLKNICESAEQIFHVPVRIGMPKGVGGLTDLVSGPEYSTVVGLLIHGSKLGESVRWAEGGTKIGQHIKKVANWISKHF